MVSQGRKDTRGQVQEKMVWSIQGKILLTNNNVLLVYVNNFEPNPILVNINKFKPYKYVDQTLKRIQSSENQMSLESIDLDRREEKSNEHLKD